MAQAIQQTKGNFEDKFRQLDEVLPTPNVYRNAAGEPGHQYWQQEVDYKIDVALDEKASKLPPNKPLTTPTTAQIPLNIYGYNWIKTVLMRLLSPTSREILVVWDSRSLCRKTKRRPHRLV